MSKTMRRRTSAFTLVELMIVVAIIGVLAAVAIPAFSRYIKKSREPENGQTLNKLWLGSISYYTVDHIDVNSTSLPKQFPGPNVDEITFIVGPPANTHCGCLPSRKCPGGGSYWKNDEIFRSLSIVQADAHSFLAAYSGSGTGTSAQFTAAALGDLDCDGTISSYIRNGRIEPTQGDVTGQVSPYAINPGE